MNLTNFRDLGGLKGAGDRKIRKGLLLRGGQPVGMCVTDVEKLKSEYKLAHIIDFRGQFEVEKDPVDEIEGAKYVNIDVLASQMKKQQKAPTLDDMIKNLKSGMADKYMCEVYVDFVTSEEAQIGYRQFIDELLNATGASLFHCFAGKDRTGWGAVIILKILGVTEADIMDDFLASIEGRKLENGKLIEDLRIKGMTEEQISEFEQMMSVKPLYLQVAFDTVRKEFGTFDHYLRNGLKLTDQEIDELRDKFLEKAI